ncbi:MAG: T9SS type A sorting domain-containing protein [Phaeodactylibacter sp.]|nr:T9SS type A sorting domain-containing protein [Phaeodactylibacter sp.]
MKHLSYTILFALACHSLPAQVVEAPLRGNPTLQRYYAGQEGAQPEALPLEFRGPGPACLLEQEGKTYINAGETRYIEIDIDTATLGGGGQLNCLNCEGNPIGETAIVDDSLKVAASPDIVGVEYSFTVEYCGGEGCREYTLPVVGRRRGRHYFPPTIRLASEERALTQGQASVLPGSLACNTFVDAEDRYEGRGQRFYFTTYLAVDSSFYYASSRYAGVDSVYLVLCDTFAICDTFHFAFQVQRDTIKLAVGGRDVFMDDFSNKGPLTDPSLWLDADTYINREFGINPPSTGVATFDGLGPKGQPYGGGLGPADRLTSTYLDLSSISEDLFISFWLQPGGRGERPRPQDVLTLEYKDFNGDWDEFAEIIIDSFPAAPGETTPFRFQSFPIPSLYKHGAFQFRLTNYNNRNGINNIWHVDYVRLSRFARDSTLSDIAFTQPPETILSTYRSMPWWHFREVATEELSPFIEVKARNLSSAGINAGTGSKVGIEEQVTGTQLFQVDLLSTGLEANFSPGLFKERTYDLRGGPLFEPTPYNGYLNLMSGNAFDGIAPLLFETRYFLAPGAANQINTPGYEAVLRNDTVSRTTVFDNYFAYDDGTAESALVAQEDDQIAVKFTAAVDDTLRAVRMHFPHMISDISNQEFNLNIWVGRLEGEPDFVMNFLKPFYPSQVLDTLQGFTTYPLVDADGNLKPLYLPAGDFYIGWEQLTNCNFTDCIPFGLDKNTPEGQAVSYFKRNNTDEWRLFSDLGIPVPAGALMVRPVVGSETPGPTSTGEVDMEAFQVQVFPNPARDVLNLYPATGSHEDYRIELYNGVGQLIHQGLMQPQLGVSRYESGLYLLRVTAVRDGSWIQKKVMLAGKD